LVLLTVKTRCALRLALCLGFCWSLVVVLTLFRSKTANLQIRLLQLFEVGSDWRMESSFSRCTHVGSSVF